LLAQLSRNALEVRIETGQIAHAGIAYMPETAAEPHPTTTEHRRHLAELDQVSFCDQVRAAARLVSSRIMRLKSSIRLRGEVSASISR